MSADWDGMINECKELASYFIQSGYKVVLYYQVKSDKAFVERLYQEIKRDGVIYKREMVWYDDLSFYKTISAVVSNRLHSLLLGGAFGAYPVCVCNYNEKTIKIKHVFESAFSDSLPLLFDVQGLLKTNINNLISNNLDSFINEYDFNTALCKEIIKQLVI
jgi:polysaccharide pyruvyl transferase WcaK-like protein